MALFHREWWPQGLRLSSHPLRQRLLALAQKPGLSEASSQKQSRRYRRRFQLGEVTCRLVDFDNFYLFLMSGTGEAESVKLADGELVELEIGRATIYEATNHIRGDCVGSDLTLVRQRL